MRPACRNGRIATLNNAKIILFIRKKKDYNKSLNKMSSLTKIQDLKKSDTICKILQNEHFHARRK